MRINAATRARKKNYDRLNYEMLRAQGESSGALGLGILFLRIPIARDSRFAGFLMQSSWNAIISDLFKRKEIFSIDEPRACSSFMNTKGAERAFIAETSAVRRGSRSETAAGRNCRYETAFIIHNRSAFSSILISISWPR